MFKWMMVMMAMIGALMFSEPAMGDELKFIGVLDTGAFACNSGYRDMWLMNPTGKDIRIKAVEIWMGMSEGGVADFGASFFGYNQQQDKLWLIHFVGWDHYAPTNMPGNFRKSFTPDWMTIRAGEYFRLLTFCQGYSNITGHTAVYIEYTE